VHGMQSLRMSQYGNYLMVSFVTFLYHMTTVSGSVYFIVCHCWLDSHILDVDIVCWLQKEQFVGQTLEVVELDSIAGQIVGIPGLFGLSGEQFKRLTIAVELVANPSILFMGTFQVYFALVSHNWHTTPTIGQPVILLKQL
jgi:hypothetical protein